VALEDTVEEGLGGLGVPDVHGLGLGDASGAADRLDGVGDRLGASPAPDHRRSKRRQLDRSCPAQTSPGS
jgi:hypothetical protein